MALPPEHANELVLEVHKEIAGMTSEQLGALPGLQQDDLLHFGMLVQSMCFVDMNLRRALEVFHHVKMIPKEHIRRYPDYSDSELCTVLADTLKAAKEPNEELSEALTRLNIISHARLHRNLIGHFSAKRHPEKEVYIFASKSDRDARKVLGKPLGKHGVNFAVAGRKELMDLIQDIGKHELWLAQKLPVWNARYPS